MFAIPLCLLLLSLLVSDFASPTPGRGFKLLLLLRPRSRHTSMMYPLNRFTTPLVEVGDIALHSKMHFERLNDLLYIIHIDSCYKMLDASRCILTHSMHSIYDSATKPSSLSAAPIILSSSSRKFFISAIILDDPYASNEAIEQTILQPIIKNTFQHLERVFKEVDADAELRYRVIVDSANYTYFLTKQLSRGLASPVDKGEGLREMLASKEAYRRPHNGVLKRFSLNRLSFRTKTSLEPEIALLMCSFAKLVPKDQGPFRVLDCFCGSCMLLLAASIHMAIETSMTHSFTNLRMVGVDANRDVFDLDGIEKNFKHMNKSHIFKNHISLYQGYCDKLSGKNPFRDLNHVYGQNCDEMELFDAIITDPPYDMNERIRDDNDENDENYKDDMFYRKFLSMAADKLNIGGRIVFFFPQVGKGDVPPSICYDDEVMQHFTLVHSIRQRFSPTFSRYLIAMEKRC